MGLCLCAGGTTQTLHHQALQQPQGACKEQHRFSIHHQVGFRLQSCSITLQNMGGGVCNP